MGFWALGFVRAALIIARPSWRRQLSRCASALSLQWRQQRHGRPLPLRERVKYWIYTLCAFARRSLRDLVEINCAVLKRGREFDRGEKGPEGEASGQATVRAMGEAGKHQWSGLLWLTNYRSSCSRKIETGSSSSCRIYDYVVLQAYHPTWNEISTIIVSILITPPTTLTLLTAPPHAMPNNF